jgi:HSP20 family protein
MMMMAKKEKDNFPVTEENFFLDENTLTNDWMDNVVPETLEGELAIDVYETAKEVVIKAPIAGVDGNEDLDITIADDIVTIRGERKEEKEVQKDSYHAQECYWGAFSRTVTLPTKVLSDEASADFKKGILTIRLPKTEANKVKKLKVNLG